jgi:voltage-gated potassium channel
MTGRIGALLTVPLLRRVAWHFRRARSQLDRRTVLAILGLLLGIVFVAALIVTLLERPWTLKALADSFYWAMNTVLGSGDPAYVSSPVGWVVSWGLILLGLTMLAAATGLLIGFIIDFVMKEGQGMGASGYRDHIVVCGWNRSAQELIEELQRDEYGAKVVLLHQAERSPARNKVYFINGDPAEPADLARAGIQEAAAALVFPSDGSDEADMRSILTVMAIESTAPDVRTVVEVNNPRHVGHLQRAHADEVLVTSRLAAHLLARSALYPGLTELVQDMVSGGEGAELYRIRVPDDYLGLTVDQLSATLRERHEATLLAVQRGDQAFVNPRTDFRIEAGDDALVLAESLKTLAPLSTVVASQPREATSAADAPA